MRVAGSAPLLAALFALVVGAVAPESVAQQHSSWCPSPRQVSVRYGCLDKGCLGGKLKEALELCPEFPQQQLRISFSDTLRITEPVRFVWVNPRNEEVEYQETPVAPKPGSTVIVQQTYVSHAWRVRGKISGKLYSEIAPQGRLELDGGKIMLFHDKLQHVVSNCAALQQRGVAPQVPQRIIKGSKLALSNAESVGGLSTPGEDMELEKAHKLCMDRVQSHGRTYADSVFYAVDEGRGGNLTQAEQDMTMGHVLKGAKYDRAEFHVSRTFSITFELVGCGTASGCSAAGSDVGTLRERVLHAIGHLGIHFLDVVHLEIYWIETKAGARISHYARDVSDKSMRHALEAVTKQCDALAKEYLIGEWGGSALTWDVPMLQKAWRVAMELDLGGPSAWKPRYGAVVVDDSHPALWTEFEMSTRGIHMFSGAAQLLFINHMHAVALSEVTHYDNVTCSAEGMSAGSLIVRLRRNLRSKKDPTKKNPDTVCATLDCEANEDHMQGRWRERGSAGKQSALDAELYDQLHRLVNSTWHGAAVPTPDADKNDARRDEVIPWPRSDQGKRVVIDGLLTREECQQLIDLGKPFAVSGTSYTGHHRVAAAKNNVGSAPFASDTRRMTPAFDVISRVRAAVVSYFNLTELYISNSQLTARVSPGPGHICHSDDCIWREDRKICEASNKPHECCVHYHWSAILMLTDQDNRGTWQGSRFYFQNTLEHKDGDDVAEYPRRIHVDNKCGRLVAFSAGEENPHGVGPISAGKVESAVFDPLAVGETMTAAQCEGLDNSCCSTAGASAGSVASNATQAAALDRLDYARWVVTSWFTTDQRFEAPDFTREGYTIDPFDKDSLWQKWLRGGATQPFADYLAAQE